MSIGLFDADLAAYGAVPFNLELMKLSTYYKQRREIVLLSTSLLPGRHQRTFVRKDYDNGKFPTYDKKYDVITGGLAYSGNKYVPLPQSVEDCIPDTYLYQAAAERFFGEEEQKIFRAMTKAEHGRLSLDGKTIWKYYKRQFKDPTKTRLIYLHDPNLGEISGAASEVLNLVRSGYKVCQFGNKFPIRVTNEEELLTWLAARPHSLYSDIEFLGEFSNEGFLEFCRSPASKEVKSKLKYRIAASSSSENDFLNRRLPRILEEVIILRRLGLKILLKYEDKFSIDLTWASVITLLNMFINAPLNQFTEEGINSLDYDTLFRFVSSFPNTQLGKKNQEFARAVFKFVKDNNYPLFQKFYECTPNSLKEKYQWHLLEKK